MVRGSGIRDIAEVERISIGKVLRTLTESAIFLYNHICMKLLGISCFLYICEVEKSEILVQL